MKMCNTAGVNGWDVGEDGGANLKGLPMAYQPPRLRPERFLGLSWDDITTRLSGAERQQALALWQWAAPRYSSLGTAQNAYWARYGSAATYRRIERVRQWLGLPAWCEA